MKILYTGTAHKIRDKKTEDLRVLDSLDDLFRAKRGYVIRLPSPGSPVVVTISGGLDSTINTFILLKELHLKVYPVFINRGQSNYEKEKKAVEYFNEYFKENFPELYNDYIEVSLAIPPREYKDNLRRLKKFKDNSRLRMTVAYPARNPVIALIASEYAYSLQEKGIYAKSVFFSHNADDIPLHSTLTYLRSLNVTLCHIMGDWNWQLISIPIEREFDNYYGKEPYVTWAVKNGFPVAKSWSCYKNEDEHCGECIACEARKKAFMDSGIQDPTAYLK